MMPLAGIFVVVVAAILIRTAVIRHKKAAGWEQSGGMITTNVHYPIAELSTSFGVVTIRDWDAQLRIYGGVFPFTYEQIARTFTEQDGLVFELRLNWRRYLKFLGLPAYWATIVFRLEGPGQWESETAFLRDAANRLCATLETVVPEHLAV